MNYAESTHRSRWLFTSDQLNAIRLKVHMASLATDEEVQEETSVSLQEVLSLLRFYEKHILKICEQFKFPLKVQVTALYFFKRVFLVFSPREVNGKAPKLPKNVMLTCIYLACKVEEAYISAEEFCRHLQQEVSTVLRNEVAVMQALNFDMVVHSPYRALVGIFQDIRDSQQSSPKELDDALASASTDLLSRAQNKAKASLDLLMTTDVPLMFAPGQIALAATRSGLNSQGVKINKYMERVVRKSVKMSPPRKISSPRQTTERQVHHELMKALEECDRLAIAGTSSISEVEAGKIDRKLRLKRQKT